MKFSQSELDRLSEKAQHSERLRANLDLRTDAHDQSQRMLNALEPGTVLPVHRHRNSAETLVMVRGSLKELLYDDEGRLTDSFVMEAGGEFTVLQIEKGQWHSLECLETGTVIFEAKDRAYNPLEAKDILIVNTLEKQ